MRRGPKHEPDIREPTDGVKDSGMRDGIHSMEGYLKRTGLPQAVQ